MSMTERTFAIIKPDAVAAGRIGEIIVMIQKAGFRIVAMRMMRMSQREAEGFYAVHRERSFFPNLVSFMTEGPCVVMALEGENAVQRWREVMGPTNSRQAPKGTVRGEYGTDIERNAVHGSDSPENAVIELSFFFRAAELL